MRGDLAFQLKAIVFHLVRSSRHSASRADTCLNCNRFVVVHTKYGLCKDCKHADELRLAHEAQAARKMAKKTISAR
jgi:hypothetical protein